MEKELKEREIITTEEDIDKNNPAYFENNENREFYVYEHIRLDNMTCFYVGKGKGKRAYDLERNDHHDRISNRHGHAVLIIKDNLTEEEAFELERDTIEDYVFNLGYGIDIDGYRDYSNNKYLTNMTFGGEGTSGLNAYANKTPEEIEIIGKKISEKVSGEKNGMWGKPSPNRGKKGLYHHSEEAKRKMSESHKGIKNSEEHNKKISELLKGENNPMYGKNAYANKTEEEMETIGKKISEKVSGEKNGMWGKPSPNRRKVICITTGKIFNSQTEAGNYYNVSNISRCCKGIYKSSGELPDGIPLKWVYLENYNNEFKGILINPCNKGIQHPEKTRKKDE